MLPVISALVACIAGLLRSRASRRLEHLALRHQLAVYQRSVPRPRIRTTDRLFWSWLSRLWSGWQSALVFVQPRTVIAWQRQRFRDHWRQLSQQGVPGRPTMAKEVRDLIRKMWQTNPTWGAPRIVGELRKLGIEVAKSTVETYRVRPQKPPSPTWKTFLKNHVQDFVSLDFFVVPTVRHTLLFVLVWSAKMNGSAGHVAEEEGVGGINSASTSAGVRTMTILPSRVRCSWSSEIKVHPACWATAAYTASAPRKPYWAASARAW
jgi:putative transposase